MCPLPPCLMCTPEPFDYTPLERPRAAVLTLVQEGATAAAMPLGAELCSCARAGRVVEVGRLLCVGAAIEHKDKVCARRVCHAPPPVRCAPLRHCPGALALRHGNHTLTRSPMLALLPTHAHLAADR